MLGPIITFTPLMPVTREGRMRAIANHNVTEIVSFQTDCWPTTDLGINLGSEATRMSHPVRLCARRHTSS